MASRGWNNPFFKYVVRESFSGADAIASGAGAIVLLVVAHLVGIAGTKMLSADDFARSVEIALIGFVAIWLVIMLGRACWWPFHWRLEPHGGLISFLRARLGTFMWPVVLIAAGFFAFIVLSGVGVIWLSLQVLSGASVARDTPNTVGNPDFAIFAPQGRYQFKWDPAANPRIDLRIDTNHNPDYTNNPAFILRNKTNTVAYNIVVTWKSETATKIEELVKSPKLAKFKFDLTETKITIYPPTGTFTVPFSYYLDDSPSYTIPVISKEVETYFPVQLWPLTALYLISKMPAKLGDTSDPIILRVTLNWETSEGKKQRDYRVRISTTNAKATDSEMPVAEGFLNFGVEEIAR